jgi:hypothetical protein
MSDDVQTDFEGRKVFFLYPNTSILTQIISELIQQEYEVYVSKDHNRNLRVLKMFTNSVVFINIDDGQKHGEWESWITKLQSSCEDLQFGVFSSNSSDEMKEKYLNELKITCGYMSLEFDMSKTAETISAVLEKMNVKGRRKYLRSSTEGEQTAVVNMPFNTDYINGSIKDISVVGFSCSFDLDPGFKKNSLYKNIQLRLKTILLKVDAVMYGSRPNKTGDTVYVFLFTQKTDSEVKVKIRKYIQQNLQTKIDSLVG